jgi:hypothetical protein
MLEFVLDPCAAPVGRRGAARSDAVRGGGAGRAEGADGA